MRLFAVLRERAGGEWVELDLSPGATVADAIRALSRDERLRELLERLPVRMAVNRDYADDQTRLAPDDELALIPPLSGGSPAARAPRARIREEPLSLAALLERIGDPAAGAIVLFQGVTREIPSLDYEAYVEMARERIERILADCVEAHELTAAAAEHRVGSVPLGEPSVIVAVSAPHREQAFAAAREAIDRIKAEAPIWKREIGASADGPWVPGVEPPVGAPAPGSAGAGELTHVDGEGRARMVDVGAKQPSERVARARARVRMSPGSARAVRDEDGPKGEVIGVARLAGIQAAKQTGMLIPLAHPLPLTYADVAASVDADRGLVELTSEVRTVARTGVEMEAMTACAVAALTVYDMVKGLERGIVLEQVALLEKRGGRSDYRRHPD
ncbi:MAG TPA: cyclic pyranopterin monophosphate synthase MoaC [Solirubrobacteraceae bacterium]|nr:cyclic pyranopterin monophosphate synthase MoaC [Solirubrobacteraceae bacterium]